MGARNMRREVVPAHDSVSALSTHVSIRFFSVANIELGSYKVRRTTRKENLV